MRPATTSSSIRQCASSRTSTTCCSRTCTNALRWRRAGSSCASSHRHERAGLLQSAHPEVRSAEGLTMSQDALATLLQRTQDDRDLALAAVRRAQEQTRRLQLQADQLLA